MCGNRWKLYCRVSKLRGAVSILITWSAVLSGSWVIQRDSIWGGADAGWSSRCECGKYCRPASYQSVWVIEKDLTMSVVEEFWRHCQNKPTCLGASWTLVFQLCLNLYHSVISKPALRSSNSQLCCMWGSHLVYPLAECPKLCYNITLI